MILTSEYPSALKVPISERAFSISRFMVLTIISTAHRKKSTGKMLSMGARLSRISSR